MLVNNICEVFLKNDTDRISESYLEKPNYKEAFVVLLDDYVAVLNVSAVYNFKIMDSFQTFKNCLENLSLPDIHLIPLLRIKRISTTECDAFTTFNKIKNSKKLELF